MFGAMVFTLCEVNSSNYIHARFHGDKYNFISSTINANLFWLDVSKWQCTSLGVSEFLIITDCLDVKHFYCNHFLKTCSPISLKIERSFIVVVVSTSMCTVATEVQSINLCGPVYIEHSTDYVCICYIVLWRFSHYHYVEVADFLWPLTLTCLTDPTVTTTMTIMTITLTIEFSRPSATIILTCLIVKFLIYTPLPWN